MKPEFYRVYDELYRNYLFDNTKHLDSIYNYFGSGRHVGELPPELTREMIYETQRAIDNAVERRDGYAVRPDAKYFLLVNFYEMVLRPIAAELRTRGLIGERFDRDRMREDLKHDVELILEAAEEHARYRSETDDGPPEAFAREGVREISGHSVIDAIGGVWNKIKYNEYLYWGRNDG
jgi:hypothetical protein